MNKQISSLKIHSVNNLSSLKMDPNNCTQSDDPLDIDDCSRQVFDNNYYEKSIFSADHEGMWYLLGIPMLSMVIVLLMLTYKCLKKKDENILNVHFPLSSRPHHFVAEISKVIDPDD